MIGGLQPLRRYLYRFFPAAHSAFYPARRRGLDYWAVRGGLRPVAEVQREFLLRWIPPDGGSFLELDAGDGVIGSHAVWLEEAGWLGDCFEERVEAARVLKKNRSRSCRVGAGTEAMFGKPVDLVTARRDSSINWITDRISDTFRPRRVIFQARDPEPEIFKAMNQAGYRLDHFIHDDEYYRWKG